MATRRKIISIHEKKKKGISLWKFFYRLILLSFFGVIVYIFFFSGFLFINQINISGLEELKQENILDAIGSEIGGKYLGILDRNNLLLARSGFMEKKLLAGFLKIGNVNIRKKFPNTLLVDIKERKSALVFCQRDECFMIDENGIAYSRKDFSLPEIYEERLVTLLDTGGSSVSIGEQIFEKKDLEYIFGIGEKMKTNLDIEMGKTYETPSRVSSDIRAATSEGWKIYFNENINLQKEVDMLQVVLLEKVGDKKSDLEYVDLRSDNKVYYKFKEGTQNDTKIDENKPEDVLTDNKIETKKKKKK